ncbi:MAG TPA: DUF6152 family protein [Caulobacteraceae bacterium]
MQIFSRRLGLAFAAAAVLASAAPALAHHSFAMFDMAQEKTISGTVTDFQWTNPHTWIWLETPAASGAAEQWGVEGMSPNFLERRGWSKNTLRRGDKVSVVIHPVKNGGHGGSFVRVTLPDGKVMDMMGGSAPIYPAPTPAPKT